MQYMAQFAIIRMQKFQVSDVQGIQKHNQRQGTSKSNPDIDYSKTEQNYDLLNDDNLKYESEIKEKISERVKRKPRANSVVLSEFLVTASPEYMNSLSAEEQKTYFEKSLEFIQERYGQKNTLYAVIHHDEATPHMHVGVIPITEDNRLSAKDIFNKQELRELQEEFPKHLQEHDFEIVRGEKGSEKKHLSSQEYKEKQDLEKEIQLLDKEIEGKKKEFIDLSEALPQEKLDVKVRKEIKSEVKQKLFGDAEITKKETGNYVLTPKQLKELTGYVNAALAVTKDYERLQSTDLVKENKALEASNDSLHSLLMNSRENYTKLSEENQILISSNKDLKARVADLTLEIKATYQSVKEFVKEHTKTVRDFRSVFKDFADRIMGKTSEVREKGQLEPRTSEFEKIHQKELRRERDNELSR
jgi:hypothetical protein